MKALAVLSLLLLAAGAPAAAERRPCASHEPLRQAFFGDLHVHTALSFDAWSLGVRATPRDAYRFARGEEIELRPYDAAGHGLRRARLARPLDFAAVTDHAELLGETRICDTPGLPGHGSLVCRLARRWPLLAYYVVNGRIFNVADPLRYGFCGEGGRYCTEAAAGPWREIQRAADEAHDDSSACRFTSFVGYEWSGNPDSNMIHRNVIFRNETVPAMPTSYVEEPTPAGLWRRLREDCLDAGTGCDALAIPHNSNLSGGRIFVAEVGAYEPLVEVLQHKGDSECRAEGLAGMAPDELCAFEKLPFASMDRQRFPFLWRPAPEGSFVREALAEGLREQERSGKNPFRFGLLASTDTHQGTPGLVDEQDFPGHAAGGDTARVEVPALPDSIDFNPGGLAVVWAEENSRESLFSALRRREAYGTSGPRLRVRFFGGFELPQDLCARHDFAEQGYRAGVPMGGLLPPIPAGAARAPRFAVRALRDAGTRERPGALLQRIQIVKLAVRGGHTSERVFEVAGDPANGADVDVASCEPRGPGADQLCTVWSDPEFDPAAHALYYARVVENPSCRWSAHVCNARGVGCDAPRSIQERAWTSPIWYAP